MFRVREEVTFQRLSVRGLREDNGIGLKICTRSCMFVYLYGNHNFKTFSSKKSVHSVMLGVALLKKASFKEFSN